MTRPAVRSTCVRMVVSAVCASSSDAAASSRLTPIDELHHNGYLLRVPDVHN